MHQYACPHCHNVFMFAYPAEAGPATEAQCPTCQQRVTVTRPVDPVPAPVAAGGAPNASRRPRRARRSNMGGWILLAVLLVGAGAAGAALVWHRAETAQQGTSEVASGDNLNAAAADQTSARPATSPGPSPPAATTWADAETQALRLGGYEVRIRHGEWGPLLGRDASNAVITADEEALQIVLRVRNVSSAARGYRSWYAEESATGDEPMVLLADSQGVYYPLALYEDVRLRGHTPEETLERGQSLEDVLVFAVPDEVDVTQVDYLRLQLAGTRQGEAGTLRFEIPVSMIRNWN